ncbi:MAG: FMN-binding negative transcriptional regulator [Comamonas sp.]|jgi:transcriptional regulator|uniref:FMN-binding negative transcriptional regulator n=1 Tax=Comamonas sp. TaxID=34028 RepID=UPI0028230D82|nr:FMN-binding negative transcriptional regulator [Comamonas sp.]MDR0215076.1 FMN-binding negative transcriptional regulator [Comamonas sp.]
MYNPSHFAVTDESSLHALIRQHPLGCLVMHGPDGLDANHLPFELLQADDGSLRLQAHVARANPLWQQLANGDQAMVIFKAADSYISPNWYPSKHQTHEQVPTWNYQVVHVHGKIQIRDDEKFLRGVLGRLTRTHEARAAALPGHDFKPWKMSDAPAAYLQKLLGTIVGLEIEVQRLEGKFKLSQNKEASDRVALVQTLSVLGQTEMAQAIDKPV